MLTFSIKVKSKRLLLIFIMILTVFLIFIEFLSNQVSTSEKVLDNEQRVNFINNLNIKILEEPVEVKEIIIPNKFSDVYEKYNQIQLLAGYDLKLYNGQKATLYKYATPEHNGDFIYVNLIILNGRIIGGDISSVKINGSILPLKEQKIET